MADLDHLADQISRLSLREALQLAKRVLDLSGVTGHVSKDTYGTSDTYAVTLTGHGSNKISVIKVVREVTGMGLKEAKDLVESTPRQVKKGLTLHGAEELRRRLIEVGADAQLVRDL